MKRNFAGFVPPSDGEPLGWGYRERSERQSFQFSAIFGKMISSLVV